MKALPFLAVAIIAVALDLDAAAVFFAFVALEFVRRVF